MDYRFTLEPYKSMKSLYICPNCEKKTFTRYIDAENDNKHLNNKVGKCSRLIKCNYHHTPKQFFQDNKYIIKAKLVQNTHTNIQQQPKPTTYMSVELVKKSMFNNANNNFIHFLEAKLFGKEITKQVINEYKIGTSIHWNGATVFWQIDEKYKVRTGKIMLYNKDNGKRIKTPFNHIQWVHKTNKIINFNLEQCFFGLHLINKYRDLPIAIVESEKTAIIASVYLPEFVWLACGSLNNLSKKRTEVLKGKDVVLFPDLKAFELWKNKIPTLSDKVNFLISDLLENNSTQQEKEQGYDIADYMINMDIDFRKHINN